MLKTLDSKGNLVCADGSVGCGMVDDAASCSNMMPNWFEVFAFWVVVVLSVVGVNRTNEAGKVCLSGRELLLHKHEELSSNLEYLHKNLGPATCSWYPALYVARTGGLLTCAGC